MNKYNEEKKAKQSTRKNCSVDPPLTTPYLISVCLTKPSALSIGLVSFSTVKKAARIIQINFFCI
jgi:hypothetical protein